MDDWINYISILMTCHKFMFLRVNKYFHLFELIIALENN